MLPLSYSGSRARLAVRFPCGILTMQAHVPPRPAAPVLAVAGFLFALGVAPPAHAQGPWDARLDVTPFPSPYLSDWESNPSLGTLTITNPTSADQQVLLVYRVTDHRGGVIASGRSDSIARTVPASWRRALSYDA